MRLLTLLSVKQSLLMILVLLFVALHFDHPAAATDAFSMFVVAAYNHEFAVRAAYYFAHQVGHPLAVLWLLLFQHSHRDKDLI